MKRFLTTFLLAALASVGQLRAVPEDDGRMVTGETEEAAELIPETIIPWHDSLLELPEWISQEAAEIQYHTRPANHGAGLFPPEVWPLQPEPGLGPLIRDEALAGSSGPRPVRESDISPVVLGPELMALYTSGKPDRVLVDPQHLEPGDRVESLVQRWLNEQCVFRTTVLLFGAGQQLPAGFDPQALRREWFGDAGEELLVFYFHGEPERTLAIFGPEARTRYGADLLRSVVDAAVTEAGRVSGGPEQLERFCYKMSVRLHWLARTTPGAATAKGSPAEGPLASTSLKKAALLALLAAGLIAAGTWFLSWYRRRHPGRVIGESLVPVMLPDRDFQPRFGAPHSGGFCSMTTFAKTSGPPGRVS